MLEKIDLLLNMPLADLLWFLTAQFWGYYPCRKCPTKTQPHFSSTDQGAGPFWQVYNSSALKGRTKPFLPHSSPSSVHGKPQMQATRWPHLGSSARAAAAVLQRLPACVTPPPLPDLPPHTHTSCAIPGPNPKLKMKANTHVMLM